MVENFQQGLEDEQWEIVLEEGTEEDFILREGVNRGFIMVSNKVHRCYLLSGTAKNIYYHLRSFASLNNGKCKANQYILASMMSVSVNTVRKYLYELKNTGFVKIIQKEGGPNTYILPETRTIGTLHHSEILHSIQANLTKKYKQSSPKIDSMWLDALTKYKESDLCNQLSTASVEDIKKSAPIIENWFNSYFRTIIRSNWNVKVLSNNEMNAISEGQGGKKPRHSFKDLPVEEWSSNHFCQYFSYAYKQRFNAPYLPVSLGSDRGRMAAVFKVYVDEYGEAGGRINLKEAIDIYITNNYFTKARTIPGFSSSYIQGEIQNYKRTGSFTAKQSKINSFSTDAEKEAYGRQLDEEFEV